MIAILDRSADWRPESTVRRTKKALILDPGCRDLHGHYYATTKSLLDALHNTKRFAALHRKASPHIRFDDEVTIWRWPEVRTLMARVFRQASRTDSYRELMKSRNADAMLRFARKAKLGAGDAVIVHSAVPIDAHSLAVFAREIDRLNGPVLHVRLLDSCLPEYSRTDQENGLALLAEAAHDLSSLRVYTETVELGAEMEAAFGFPPLRQWLIPMNSSRSDPPAEKTAPKDCFVVGLLGGKRKEQGGERIPEIVKLLAQRQRQAGLKRVRVLIQKPHRINQDTKSPDHTTEFMASMHRLSSDCPVELELLDSNLDGPAFKDAVARSHVLLLPYDVQSYRNRGSGLIIEGALSGTPVIVTEGFAMADWQEIAGSPAASSVAGYVDALLAVANDYRHYREGAIRAGNVMRRAMMDNIAEIQSVNLRS